MTPTPPFSRPLLNSPFGFVRVTNASQLPSPFCRVKKEKENRLKRGKKRNRVRLMAYVYRFRFIPRQHAESNAISIPQTSVALCLVVSCCTVTRAENLDHHVLFFVQMSISKSKRERDSMSVCRPGIDHAPPSVTHSVFHPQSSSLPPPSSISLGLNTHVPPQ